MEEYKVTQLKILGLEVGKKPVPKWLHRYEDKPLFFYRLFMQYKAHSIRYCQKRFSGRCTMALKTSVDNCGGLVYVSGHIFMRGCSASDITNANYIPKETIVCLQLNNFVKSYIGSGGLGDRFFDPDIFGIIKNDLFSCNLEPLPMVNINRASLDMVSVNMKLFKPV